MLLGNTVAGVLNLNYHIIIGRHDLVTFTERTGIFQSQIAGTDGDLSTIIHGIPGVHTKINDYLFQLPLVNFDRPQITAVFHIQFDILTNQTP